MDNTIRMYAVFFEARSYSGQNKPVGRILELSDPDIFPATNDEEAIKIAFDRAELIEYLKSLRIRKKISARKLLVRVKTIICKGETDKIILTPKYKGEFKKIR